MKDFFVFLYKHRLDIFYIIVLFFILAFGIFIFQKDETRYFIGTIENKAFDIRQNIISQNKKSSEDIIIVRIDDPSYEFLIEKYGDWPIPRNVYANLVEYIQSQNPKYVAFDLLFVKSLNRVKNSDAELVNLFKNYQNVYTAINFDTYNFEFRKPSLLEDKLSTQINFLTEDVIPYKFTNCRKILQEIIDETANIGHINSLLSEDGYSRTLPLIIQYPTYNLEDYSELEQKYYLNMTLKLAIDYIAKYEHQNVDNILVDNNNNLVIGNRKIPLNNRAEAILNWYGRLSNKDSSTFKYVSFWEVLKSLEAKSKGEQEIIPTDLFKDKIVFIGTSVFALSDIKAVPVNHYMPGVETHATLLNNIIDNSLIKEVSIFYNIIVTLIISILMILSVFMFKTILTSLFSFIGLTILYSYANTYMMSKYNLWIWLAIPILVSIFVFVCALIVKYLIKSRDFEYTYKLATTDGLTELFNHRYFQEQMKLHVKNSEKNKNTFSLILIDIDFFKKFNDKYGHQAGDAVLKHVAKTLKKCVRTNDFVCRYGGEEMAIILENTSHETAINIANKICTTVANGNYELNPDLTVNITISLGVSTYPEKGKIPSELIEYADKCMYKAKENGRNQVGFIE